MLIWLEEFRGSLNPNNSICDLEYLCSEESFAEHEDVVSFRNRSKVPGKNFRDKKWLRLTGNDAFMVKSFYGFLNDGGLLCQVAQFFWRNLCPKKITIFNWLAWNNKILTLTNLETRRCNRLPTATCVMCHSAIETADHLFF